MGVLDGLKPASVFSFFEALCAIPHGSGNTDAISTYCVDFAKQRKLEVVRDKYNNVLIRKPATPGMEDHPTVILQGHLDMVCEKEAGVDMDFAKDGLRLFVDGDLVRARGTTLGGDDGIAVAMAMAVLDSDDLRHPPLEVLFTTDEETGMDGAIGLDASLLRGRMLLNIDSEAEGVLTVGCAGGARVDLTLPLSEEAVDWPAWKIEVDGLIGGHSGVEIHKGRLNADKVLGELLQSLPVGYRLIHMEGGLKDNAIPVSAHAVLAAEEDPTGWVTEFLSRNQTSKEPGLVIRVTPCEGAEKAFDRISTDKAVELLCQLPNGVQAMSRDIEGLVQTSLNLGIMECKGNCLSISFSVRSSLSKEKEALLNRLQQIAGAFGAAYHTRGHYPAWEYRTVSPLRDVMTRTYERMYGKTPVVAVIHAGLECGLFSEKIPGLDAVSFGPDLYDIHTPRERMSIASVARTYAYLCEVLAEL